MAGGLGAAGGGGGGYAPPRGGAQYGQGSGGRGSLAGPSSSSSPFLSPAAARFIQPVADCEYKMTCILEEMRRDSWPVPSDSRSVRPASKNPASPLPQSASLSFLLLVLFPRNKHLLALRSVSLALPLCHWVSCGYPTKRLQRICSSVAFFSRLTTRSLSVWVCKSCLSSSSLCACIDNT